MDIPLKEFNWRAFDERKFFRDFGVELDPNKGLPGILEAICKYFGPPADTTGSVLDTEKFNKTMVDGFVTEVMRVNGYEPTAELIDPALSRELFKRWFLQIASPPSGSGNGGSAVSPFNDVLLRATHPDASHRKVCANAVSAEAESPLPRIDELRIEVGQEYSRIYGRLQKGSVIEWVKWVGWTMDGLFEIFEPAMARKDLPESFRYGSLDWALLTIGIELVGDAHREMSYDQLILLGAAADVFSEVCGPDDQHAGEDVQAFRQKCMHTILRMAHVQGKIDLRNKREVSLEDVETALTFFQSQSRSLESESAPYEELIAGLQTRSDVAKAMLREKDFDPDRPHHVSGLTTNSGAIGTQRVHRHTCTPDTVPPPQSKCAPLYEILMMDWIGQLGVDQALTGDEKQRLETLRHADLERRFNKGFGDVLARLEREVMAPALRKRYQELSAKNQEFLECGKWKVKIVTEAAIRTEGLTAGVQGRSGLGSGGMGLTAHPIKKNRMIEAVLIESTLMTDGKPETRHYWATLNPLEVRPYGSDKDLFRNKKLLNRFFKPLEEGDKLLEFIGSSDLRYETYSAQWAGERPEKKIIDLLLRDNVAKMREAARQITEPEAARAERKNFLMRLLLPFFSCFDSLRKGEKKQAISDCTFDVLAAAASFAGPVTKAGRTMLSIGKKMTPGQIRSVASAFLFKKPVDTRHAYTLISTTLKLGAPAKAVGAAAVGYLDPGIGLAVGLLSGAARVVHLLGGRARSLIEKLKLVPTAAPLLKQMREARRSHGKELFKSGFRRIAPAAAAPSSHLKGPVGAIEDTSHRAPQDDAMDRVETIQNYVGHGHRPVPPAPQAVAHQKPLCREKRAGDDGPSRSCAVVLRPDARFGIDGHTPEAAKPVNRVQLSVMKPNNADAAQKVNLADIVFSQSRFIENLASWQARIPNTRDFDNAGTGLTASLNAATHLPEKISAKVIAHTDAAGSVEYVAIDFHENRNGERYWNRQYQPFGSYQEIDGARIGLVAVGNRHYRFDVDAGKVLTEADNQIELTLATPAEIQKFRRYQAFSAYEFKGPDVNYGSLVRLRDCPPEMKRHFHKITIDAGQMLEDATDVLDRHPDIANRICGRFSAGVEQTAQIVSVFRRRVEQMKESQPYLDSQREHVVGFFTNPKSTQRDQVLGETIFNAMQPALGFSQMNKPMILLNSRYFFREQPDSRVPLSVQDISVAGTWLHEWGHALKGFTDGVKGGAPFYAKREGNRFNLQPMIDKLVTCTAEEALLHAPFFEHLAVIFSLYRNPATRGGVEPFINGQSSYRREISLAIAGAPELELAPASRRVADAVGTPTSRQKFRNAFNAGLCRVTRNDEAFGKCTLVPAPEFGPYGYTRQTRTGATAMVFQASLFQGRHNQAPLTPFTEVNAVHLGYATRVETASGKVTHIVPDDQVRFAHRPGGVNGQQSTMHLPDAINGHIEGLAPKSGGPVVYYVVFTIGHFDPVTGATIFTTRWVPFGSHVKRDGTRFNVAYIDPDTPYVFEIPASSLPLAGSHPVITLRRGTEEEMNMFWCFQRTLSTTPIPVAAGAVKLGEQTQEVKQRFEEVFKQCNTLLDDAIRAMDSGQLKPLVAKLGAKLLGLDVGPELYAALNEIWTHFMEMRKSLPYLREQSPHAIGFFDGAQANGGNEVLGNALIGSMGWEYSFAAVPVPVISLKQEEYMGPLNRLTNLVASTLAHEWGHALRSLSDKMNPTSAKILYPEIDQASVNLWEIMKEARAPGSNPTGHAPLVEHFMLMAGGLLHGDASVMAYIHSPLDMTTYTIPPTATDFRVIFQNPIFDSLDPSLGAGRRKRSAPPFPVPDDPMPNARRSRRSRRAAGKRSAATLLPAQPSARITSVRLRS